MTAQEHNRLISILFHVQGGLQVLGGLIMILVYAGMGFYFMIGAHGDEQQFLSGFLIAGGVILAVIVFAFAVLDFYAAFKIGRIRPTGRSLGIVVACLAVLSFPLGTALGAYALWFFFSDEGKAFYAMEGPAPEQYNSPPPPPDSWKS